MDGHQSHQKFQKVFHQMFSSLIIIDGIKKTGAVGMAALLDEHGFILSGDEEDFYNFLISA